MSELSREALSLIEEARAHDAPSAEDRERMRSKLKGELGAAAFAGAALGSAALASSVGSSAVPSSTGSATSAGVAAVTGAQGGALVGFGKLAISLALLGVLGVGGFVWLSSEPKPRARPAQPAQAAASVVPSAPAAPVKAAPAPVVEPLEVPAQVEPQSVVQRRPAAKRAARAEAPAAVVAAPDPATLSAELALLSRAQLALREGHSEQALAVLAEHEARFPQGALREERLGVWALAQCAKGDDAEQVVREFARAAPHSPMMRRVREACGMK